MNMEVRDTSNGKLHKRRKPNPGALFADCKTIVDGQQRLTTVLILLKILCLKANQTTVFLIALKEYAECFAENVSEQSKFNKICEILKHIP